MHGVLTIWDLNLRGVCMTLKQQSVATVPMLKKFVVELQRLGRTNNPQEVARRVLVWTGGQSVLTDMLCRLLLAYPSSIPPGDEGQWVDYVVRSRLIQDWEKQGAAEHLRAIRDRILNDDRVVQVLEVYQHLLQQRAIESNRSQEHQILLQSRLAIVQHGQLKIANPIYSTIFDEKWVQHSLTRLPAVQIEAGSLIAGRYQVQKILGKGGFGRTYLVSDGQRFGELCVLKELLSNKADRVLAEKSQELFEREAKALHRIAHPQIPQFLALLQDHGKVFMAQEYIDGKTYAGLLKERQKEGQTFSEAEIVQWLEDLLPVLEYLHGNKMIHRDISPDNIMLPRDRAQPMLIDFGSVKLAQLDPLRDDPFGNDPEEFSAETCIGKKIYAPPEQLTYAQCFPNSDLYALAVTAVVLLTGKQPRQLLDLNSLEWRWRSYTTTSESLAQILNKMMAEKPKDRYQSAREVLAVLSGQQGSSTIHRTVAPYAVPFEDSPESADPVRSQATPVRYNIATSTDKGSAGVSVPAAPSGKDRIETQLGPLAGPPTFSPPKSSEVETPLEPATQISTAFGTSLVPLRPQTSVQTLSVLSTPRSQTWECSQTFTCQGEKLVCLTFSRAGKKLIGLSDRNTRRGVTTAIKSWDLDTGKLLQTDYLPSSAYRSLACNSDGNVLAAGGLPQKIAVFNLQSRKQIYSLPGHQEGVVCVALSPTGQILVSGGKNGQIKLWNLQTGKLIRALPHRSATMRFIAVSPDEQTLAIATREQKITLLHLRTSKLLHFDPTANEEGGPGQWMSRLLSGRGQNPGIGTIAISPDGRTLVSGDRNQKVKLWDLRGQKLLYTLTGHSSSVTAVSFSPDGQQLASSSDGEIRIWQPSTETKVES